MRLGNPYSAFLQPPCLCCPRTLHSAAYSCFYFSYMSLSPLRMGQCAIHPSFLRAPHGTSLNICWMTEERNKPQLAWEVAQCPWYSRKPQDACSLPCKRGKPPPTSLVTSNLHVHQNSASRTLTLLKVRSPPRGLWDRASFKEVKCLWKHLPLEGLQDRLQRKGWSDGHPWGAAPRAQMEISLGRWGRTQGSSVSYPPFLENRNINQLTLTISSSDLRDFIQLEILRQAHSGRFLPHLDTWWT